MIILIRHGQSTSNAEGLLVGRRDTVLTELGERQARSLAPQLLGVEAAWTSPLARARQTAALALPECNPVVKESFIEVDYGDLEGQPFSVVAAERAASLDHGHEVAFGGGESLAAVDERVRTELDALLADRSTLLHSPTRHLAIVSHVSPIKAAAMWALGVAGSTAWRTRLDNGSMTIIGVRAHSPVLVCLNAVPAVTA